MRRAAVLAVLALVVAAPPAMGAAAPAAFPGKQRTKAAKRFLRERQGLNAFSVMDTRGRLRGLAQGRRYVTASVVKAMLLVAYLRKIGRLPSPEERGLLAPMITVSDNRAATAIYGRLGDDPLWRLAKRVRMRHFWVGGHWGNAHFSAADQARFMIRFDRLVPRRTRPYARRLLSSIVPWQRWGFSRYSLGAGWRTFFKGGWRTTGSGRLVHEVALFEREGRRFALAVLTDGNPTFEYGTETLRGVAARLFGARAGAAQRRRPAGSPATRRAGLVDMHRYAPGALLDIGYATRSNVTGRRLPGYCRPWALLLRPGARDLGAVQRELRRRNRGLLVFDAYRPARASLALVRWAERTGRGHLVGTYIARRSRHNLGSAIDLSLVRWSDGRRLRMGSGIDELGPRAHTLNASGRALANRLLLRGAMERHGFTNYSREWWHYEHRVLGTRYLDVSLGCENRGDGRAPEAAARRAGADRPDRRRHLRQRRQDRRGDAPRA